MMSLPQQTALALLRGMLRIRRLEERCIEAYGAGKIRGFLHLYIGEEAVAGGAIPALDPQDAVVATYREHGHALLRGIGMRAIMAEMYGRREGCSRGRGGSMHLFDATTRFYGGHAIVGGGLPIAVGLALADQLQQRQRVTACFFGEGAIAEGVFHESLNLAALWHLPVLFCCENNFYAMGTALARSESQTDLCAKAASYGVVARRIDGMDVEAVHLAVSAARTEVLERAAPVFLELQTYRFRAHSMFDPELYRDKAEIARWKERGPIVTFSARLKEAGWLSDERLQAIEQEVHDEVADAVAFAENGSMEPVADLARDVYTPAASSP